MVNLINLTRSSLFMLRKKPDSERKLYGKYFPVLLSEWDEPFPDLTIGENGRIHLHPDYANTLVSVYVVKENAIGRSLKKCNIILLPKSEWDEVTQTRGKNAGEPLNVYPNGDLYAVHRTGARVRVFVQKSDRRKEEIP